VIHVSEADHTTKFELWARAVASQIHNYEWQVVLLCPIKFLIGG
jgi:hypothetical protein